MIKIEMSELAKATQEDYANSLYAEFFHLEWEDFWREMDQVEEEERGLA